MMQKRVQRIVGSGLALAVLVASFAAPMHQKPAQKKRKTVDYNRDVRPILGTHCLACHGADKDALAKTGNMRLDTFDGATADRGGYRAITPGDPDKSALLKRVTDKPES